MEIVDEKILVFKLLNSDYEKIDFLKNKISENEDKNIFISFGNFISEFVGFSRIDDNVILKIQCKYFNDFFNNDFEELKNYITKHDQLTIYFRTLSKTIQFNVYDIMKVPIFKDNMWMVD